MEFPSAIPFAALTLLSAEFGAVGALTGENCTSCVLEPYSIGLAIAGAGTIFLLHRLRAD